MMTAGKFIDYFIHDVLDYSVLNNESNNFIKVMECFEIREVIKIVIQMIEDKTKMKNIEIRTIFKDTNLSLIKTDKKRLTQVLLNLVNNALKFTSRGGKIEILIERVFNVNDQFSHVKFSVNDSGIGIKDEDKPKLFKLFGMI
jgi:signal transduction histidine kinase